jgi:hypothetical protein
MYFVLIWVHFWHVFHRQLRYICVSIFAGGVAQKKNRRMCTITINDLDCNAGKNSSHAAWLRMWNVLVRVAYERAREKRTRPSDCLSRVFGRIVLACILRYISTVSARQHYPSSQSVSGTNGFGRNHRTLIMPYCLIFVVVKMWSSISDGQ